MQLVAVREGRQAGFRNGVELAGIELPALSGLRSGRHESLVLALKDQPAQLLGTASEGDLLGMTGGIVGG